MAKILIVDDDEILCKMYGKILVAEGHEVIQARDAQAGLGLAQAHNPDLIMLDIMLPGGMNGFDVLENLKGNEATKHIKVMVLTNLDSQEKIAKEIGAEAYLVKVNTKQDQVIAAVNALLVAKEK